MDLGNRWTRQPSPSPGLINNPDAFPKDLAIIRNSSGSIARTPCSKLLVDRVLSQDAILQSAEGSDAGVLRDVMFQLSV
jgi:hypothetical protein